MWYVALGCDKLAAVAAPGNTDHHVKRGSDRKEDLVHSQIHTHASELTLRSEAGILVYILRYEPVLKIDPYQRKAWNSAKEIERRF
jgi:hypothetical protein